MDEAPSPVVWVIHWRYYDNSDMGIVDRAFTSEEEARWQTKLLVDLADGRLFTLHSLPLR